MEETITVIAGETTQIDCLVANARPVPAIMWMLGKMISKFYSQLGIFEIIKK